MTAKATAKNLGMSPRKVRMVVDLIRGRGVNEAYSILRFSKRSATMGSRAPASTTSLAGWSS